ncbi:hypothetical protein EUGRSUZ_L00140 [Eucalyptus grandis]|uniref:Uncharacterized protein n=2 Tax=Eucalyptus grandis TaxID=71139 RepID=A0ACC3L569_EUCGR|nr:hypothetical protein EUGRSUZ_L00140 [Eucalyptus grandis]
MNNKLVDTEGVDVMARDYYDRPKVPYLVDFLTPKDFTADGDHLLYCMYISKDRRANILACRLKVDALGSNAA